MTTYEWISFSSVVFETNYFKYLEKNVCQEAIKGPDSSWIIHIFKYRFDTCVGGKVAETVFLCFKILYNSSVVIQRKKTGPSSLTVIKLCNKFGISQFIHQFFILFSSVILNTHLKRWHRLLVPVEMNITKFHLEGQESIHFCKCVHTMKHLKSISNWLKIH